MMRSFAKGRLCARGPGMRRQASRRPGGVNATAQPGVPALSILSPAQRDRIHESTLYLLERTGVAVREREVLDMLVSAGAHLMDEERTAIPASMVEDAIRKAPKRVVIFDRKSEEKLVLEKRKVCFGAHGDSPTILDPLTRQTRED